MSTAADTPTVITAVSMLPELDNLALLTDEEVLALIERADAQVAAAQAARAQLVTEAQQREAAERTHLCSTATFLTRQHRHSSREARRIVKQATTLFGRFSLIAEAACAGLLSDSQVRGILTGLQNLPDTLSAAELDRAQELMVGFAADFAPDDLRKLSLHVCQTIDPDGTDAHEAARLEAERLQAEKNRRLSLAPDHHGSYLLAGKLPLADGEELAALLKAHESALWRAATETDAIPPTRPQMRADALMILVRRAAKVGDAPRNGGDRPRISVLVSLETLRTGLGTAQVSCGEQLSATELRRLACDADILPIVMNGKGVPMEVGTPHRLVTPEIRAALVARDKGCVFPGCTHPPEDSEAHHIQPWWAYGPTKLWNLVLLCPHHHRQVEPARDRPWNADNPERWAIRLDEDGLPFVIPPTCFNADRTPRRHARFRFPRPCDPNAP
ncbi:HNH endonuclease [Enemella dayhoffiae]|uniref:HNH endonuclease n=1 Tax=Enemella dayhoffiae TaxID=2016507 RepID=A0A255HB68_9ACTN|nr:HNH endonuclease signature motif containing protein [Enemella dayhoffiae]OYO25178.1 HNH endonuclease [Enemella dayhoffiae]